MLNKEIQELTSSEPLTLDEEYEMQINWLNDEDKLTFIVLSKELYEKSMSMNKIEQEIYSMVGDVNIFLSTDEDKEDELKTVAELEVMIVDKINRGRGYGIESIRLMINYALKFLKNPKLERFIVKIDENNFASIKMFEKLGFIQYSYSKIFKQVSLKLDIEDNILNEFNLNIEPI
jgi:RimJ/RimL family protein N-acetyltransferase